MSLFAITAIVVAVPVPLLAAPLAVVLFVTVGSSWLCFVIARLAIEGFNYTAAKINS